MNASRAIAKFDSCMAERGVPIVMLPECFGVKEGEYCYGGAFPRERGAYSGAGNRKYFGFGSGQNIYELDIGRMEDGKLNPDPVTGAYR